MTNRMLLSSLAAFGVASAFISSAVLKSRAPTDFERTIVDFGVPKRFSGLASRTIIGLELITALGLIPIRTRHLAARTSGSILSVFTVGVVANIVSGRRPSCTVLAVCQMSPFLEKP